VTSIETAARNWAATWQRCWEALDADPIVELYADDATFSSHPFREVYRGREGVRTYVEEAFADEADVSAWFDLPLVDGDRASVRWWAALREAGEESTLAGTSVLRFNADGMVVEQWDAWHLVAGRRDPPVGWNAGRAASQGATG
jgi:ketosteroid isomerase-like protein